MRGLEVGQRASLGVLLEKCVVHRWPIEIRPRMFDVLAQRGAVLHFLVLPRLREPACDFRILVEIRHQDVRIQVRSGLDKGSHRDQC